MATAPGQQLSLNEIYTWFTDSFAFYRNNPHIGQTNCIIKPGTNRINIIVYKL